MNIDKVSGFTDIVLIGYTLQALSFCHKLWSSNPIQPNVIMLDYLD